jgi:hypothetical protein
MKGYVMPKIKNIEKKIWDVEGFAVNILHPNGRDVRDDYSGLKQQYPYGNMAKNNMTVDSWKNNRFKSTYPGYDVEVLDGEGDSCTGHKKLGTVRDTYCEE